MVDSLDRLFLRPQLLLIARKVDIYDAINMVVYAKIPLVTVRRGKDLVVGSIRLNKAGSAVGILSQGQKDELLGKYEKEIASLRYPVGPSQYEPLLEKMLGAGEDTLPYFFHEHHHAVDRRCRVAMFAQLHGELAGLVSKGEIPLQITDSEGTHLMASDAWMTAKTFALYLERYRVTPWWDNEDNLKSHARLERVLLSDGLNVTRLDSLEQYDRQQLPSFLFGHMLLKRTRAPLGYAQPHQRTGDAKSVEARAPDRELQNSQYEPRPPVARTESSAASDAEHDKSSPEVAGLPSSAAARQAMRPDGICSKNVQRDPGAERGFDDEPQALPLKSPVTSSDEDPMLTKSEVAKLLRVHVNTIDNYRKQRGFPREHKFGPNTLRWKRGEILQWRDQRQRK